MVVSGHTFHLCYFAFILSAELLRCLSPPRDSSVVFICGFVRLNYIPEVQQTHRQHSGV